VIDERPVGPPLPPAGEGREGRRGRLAKLLARRAASSASRHPLSAGQRALWLLQRLEPASWAYNAVFAARVVSPLDPSAFERALGALVARHPILRTSYPEEEGSPLARVHSAGAPPITWTEGRTWSEQERWEWLVAEARRPLDLGAAPPFAVRMLVAGEADHRLLIVSHHVALDGWSLWIVLDELALLYEAERLGAAPPPPPGGRFADHVERQERMLAGPRGERLRDFWRGALSGAPHFLDLPYDRPPGAERPRHPGGFSHFFCFDGETTAGLKQLCASDGSTIYLVLLAAFQALLSRASAAVEVLVGSPFANRGPGDDDVVGYFVNPLPVRARFQDDPPFREHLRRLRETLLEIHERQDLPLPLLVDALGLPRHGTRPPLFPVFFAFQKPHRREASGIGSFLLAEPGRRARLGDLDLESMGLPQQEGQFDLTLQTIESHGGISAQLGYDPALFDAATVERLARQLRILVAAALADPDARVSELPLLDDAERRQIATWSAHGDQPRDATLHGLFLASCRRAPDAVAVESGGDAVRYEELSRWSAVVAFALADAGVRRGDRVAVIAADGAGFVAALLGVSRAGACFVCIDLQAPPERIDELLRETEAAAVVLPPGVPLAGGAPAFAAPLVAVPPVPPTEPVEPAALDTVDPEDAAFIAFTSGSTGRPKGILQSHASFCQFLRWQSGLGFGPGRRVAQWAAPTYDAAYCEIFGALGFGATLCLPDRATRFDPPAMAEWLERGRVELLQVVPSFLRELLGALADGAEPPSALDTVLVAGEELTDDLVEGFFARFAGRSRLFNLYGPTETVLATWHQVLAPDPGGRRVPVGYAIDGRQVLILDRRGRVCPVGVAGEIHVSSPHLSRGYFRRPGATAERFLPSPLPDAPDEVVFRTGDLGRWRPDGRVEFLGRRDGLIKVRGVRVELGEIEAALRRHPAVRDAAVSASGAGDELRIVAWLVPVAGGRLPPHSRLRGSLARRLPLLMMPSVFVEVGELPRTATGKLDRRALRIPPGATLTATGGSEPPRTREEREVAALWCELLDVETVCVDDDFFALGGHSLLAMRMMHELAARTGVELPARSAFEASTVEGLAERLVAARRNGSQDDVVRDLTSLVAAMSDEEVDALLAARQHQPGGKPAAFVPDAHAFTEESPT
jgi:amino acid adenylation domain-containing protein